MAETLQTAVLPRQNARKRPAAAAFAALGVVYGDIGTSTLYGLKQAAEAAGTPTPDTVMGIVSVILWSLILIVALKYAILILRADNHGEGGIVALLALLDARHAPRGSWRASLLIVGLIGAALLYGDGVITPAISVLSAVEGLKIDAPRLAPMVVPITIAILVGLFLVQRKGTEFIGNIFGPVMLVWFVAIGLLGLLGIMRTPGILGAISPHYAVVYLVHAGPSIGFAVSAPPSSPSRAPRRCMRIWAISAGCPSNSDGSLSCCPLLCSTISARGDCFWRTPTPSRIRSTCSHQGGPIIPW
jgi:KUP system potassium uptake protein